MPTARAATRPDGEPKTMTNPTVEQLVARSNRLGADKRNTNFAGGNTSAKGTDKDPVTGEDVQLLWVKGSGGDLGTLTESGLAVLRLDRLQALKDVYPGVEREDEMVAAFDYCLHGKGGAAPSIDTAMHGLVDAAHVDHLHPDAGIAIATAADGEALTAKIFGDKVAWVPWRRPGFQLGLDIAAIKDANPQAVGTILGGHGTTAWGDTSEEAETNSLWIIEQAEKYIAEHGRPEPFGPKLPGYAALPEAERRAKAAALAPVIRGLASSDKPVVGHFSDDAAVLDFLEGAEHPRLGALGTSCPDHFLRTKVKPLVLDLPADAPGRGLHRPAEGTPRRLPGGLPGLLRPPRRRGLPGPARRGPRHRPGPGRGHVLLRQGQADRPGRRGVLPQRHQRDARRGGHLHATPRSRKPRNSGSNTGRWRKPNWPGCPNRSRHATRIALVTGAASGIGKAIATRLAAEGACVVIADLNLDTARAVAAELGGSDVAVGIQADVTDEAQVLAAVNAAVLAFGGLDLVVNNAGLSISKPLLETTEKDWDLQHNVMAKGSFLVSKAAAKVLIDQGMGGDIVYISSKNSVFAGPNNIAYSATKADQAHQVRLLAAELGEYGIRVNGINPDGVVRGSGIFAGGWGAKRAAVYGVDEQDLGKYYAQRTLLKREVLPENVANAVAVLTGSELSHTTGLHIPVDAGVATAFLR